LALAAYAAGNASDHRKAHPDGGEHGQGVQRGKGRATTRPGKVRLVLRRLVSLCFIERSSEACNWSDLLPDDGRQLQHLSPQILYISTKKPILPIRHQQNGI